MLLSLLSSALIPAAFAPHKPLRSSFRFRALAYAVANVLRLLVVADVVVFPNAHDLTPFVTLAVVALPLS